MREELEPCVRRAPEPYDDAPRSKEIKKTMLFHDICMLEFTTEMFIAHGALCRLERLAVFFAMFLAINRQRASRRQTLRQATRTLPGTVAMSRSASSPSFCLTHPSTLGVGAGLHFASSMLCQHLTQICFVGHNVKHAIVQHSFTLEMFILRTHFIHCPDFGTDFL